MSPYSPMMPVRGPVDHPEAGFGHSFQDNAFDSRHSFDFEDSSYNAFGGGNLHGNVPQDMYEYDDMMQELFNTPAGPFPGDASACNPSQAWQRSNRAREYMGSGVQSDIQSPPYQRDVTNNRSIHISKLLGQITPPDDDAPRRSGAASSTARPQRKHSLDEGSGKLSNEQRARNAAHHRHHKSRSSKSENGRYVASEDVADGQMESKSLAVQREKNRIAAAKCRAKKKAGNEIRQEEAREKAFANEFLNRHVRELRDERSRLRSLILAHNPDVCSCHNIHRFNIGAAEKLVFGAVGQGAQTFPSPSQDGMSSNRSPVSDGAFSVSSFASTPIIAPETMAHSQRAQSFSGAASPAFNQRRASQVTRSGHITGQDGQHVLQEFS